MSLDFSKTLSFVFAMFSHCFPTFHCMLIFSHSAPDSIYDSEGIIGGCPRCQEDARLGKARDERLQGVVVEGHHRQRQDVDVESEFTRNAVNHRGLSRPGGAIEQVSPTERDA